MILRPKPFLILRLAAWCLAGCGPCALPAAAAPDSPLDQGFRLLYDLDFAGAQQQFAAHQKAQPDDPMGHVGEAAGYLFGEFHRLGILDSQFLTDDDTFLERKTPVPDPAVRKKFDAALARAESVASVCLKRDPKDRGALLAMTLVAGVRSDYTAMIEKRNAAALGHTKQATQWAEKLLAVYPDCHDAYVATGITKYVIGSLIAPLRWLLALGGFAGDKARGEAELELTAKDGRYLAPYARLMLAIIATRDKRYDRARDLLTGLQREFPRNPLYASEVKRLDQIIAKRMK